MPTLPIVRGTLDLLVLKALDDAQMHGYQVTSWIEARSSGSLDFDDSAIYHALYRLERRSLIGAAWGVTENNRRARYYRLLDAGRAHLRAETERLVRYTDTMLTILTGDGAG